MNIFQSIQSIISDYSSPVASQIFAERFLDSPYEKELLKPLLTLATNKKCVEVNLKNVQYEKLISLSGMNPTTQTLYLELSSNIEQVLSNQKEAFLRFVQFTSHSNALGDFRVQAPYYSELLKGLPYLCFHGDGNCVLLGILLKEFVKHFSNEDIDLFYSCGSQREFMHVYGEYTRDGQNYYIDADQKIHCELNELDEHYSHGLIYQLISGAGYHAYHKLCKTLPNAFYKMTHQLLSEYEVMPGPKIYQRNPEQEDFSLLFSQARTHIKDPVSLHETDYDWKNTYRELLGGVDGSYSLMDVWNTPISLKLPAGASFDLGLAVNPLRKQMPNVVQEFSHVFFGRVPLKLSIPIPSNVPFTYELPDLPWLINIEGCEKVHLNDNLAHIPGQTQQSTMLFMGDLESFIDTSKNQQKVAFFSSAPFKIELFFPINALALNSALFKISNRNQNDLLVNAIYQ